MHIRFSVLTAVALVSVTVASAQRAETTKDAREAVQTVTLTELSRVIQTIPNTFGDATVQNPTSNKSLRQLLAVAPGDSIMETDYDFQSNAAMGDRIINWPGSGGNNGIMSTLGYMARAVGSGERGTYGGIYADFGAGFVWQPINLQPAYTRIEPVNSGFNEIDHLSDNRVVVTSHNGTTINFAIETAVGSGTFTTTTIPGSESGLWPRIDVGGGDVIHVIWTQSVDEAPLFYTRSTDNGATWSTPVAFAGPGAGELPNRAGEVGPAATVFGADAYVVSAAGNHAAIWYYTGNGGIYQLRSTDNGASWMRSGFVAWAPYERLTRSTESCDTCYYRDPGMDNDTTTAYVSDTVATPGSTFDMLIGADGTVYGAYPVLPIYLRASYYTSGDSLIQPWFAGFNYTNIVGRSVQVALEGETFVARGDIPLPGILDNTVEFLDARGAQGGFGRWFQLGMDTENNVYMVFGSGVLSDTVTALIPEAEETGNYLRSHLFATWTRDMENWSTPLNLTPNGIDAQYPSLANLVDNELHIAYQADEFPGDYLTSSGEGGSTLHPNLPSVIRVYIVPTSMLPEPGTGSVRGDDVAAGGAILGAYPNPTPAVATIAYAVRTSGDVSLRVVNALGQTVATMVDGRHMPVGSYVASFDASGLAAGRYFVVMSVDGSVTTSPLSIVR